MTDKIHTPDHEVATDWIARRKLCFICGTVVAYRKQRSADHLRYVREHLNRQQRLGPMTDRLSDAVSFLEAVRALPGKSTVLMDESPFLGTGKADRALRLAREWCDWRDRQ